MSDRPKPIVLAILDGWGIAPPSDGNAISQAKTPIMDKLITTYPVFSLKAASEEVGLGFGEMGNSEVGHLNLGAGKVIYQNLPRINHAILDKSFFDNEVLLKAIKHAKKNKSKLHLIGLASPGGVHAHIDHLYALLELAKKEKFKDVYVHAILDGRDTIYNVGLKFIGELQKKLKTLKVGQLASLSGRYYAMDRDNHWERIEEAFKAMVKGQAKNQTRDPIAAIEAAYKKKVYDEEFPPTVITDDNDKPITTIDDGDSAIFFNFRADRGRQLTKAFVLPDFNKFERTYFKDLFFVTLMEYEKDLPVEIAFPPITVDWPLARVLSENKLKQLHIAETEKYVHVTFFFNGLKDICYDGEDQVVVPSPRVSSYDKKPAMSAPEVTKKVIAAIKDDKYDFILVNFANPDMVAHTGNLSASIEANEIVDDCIGKISDVVLAKDGVLFISADHGNAEELVNLQTGEKDKEHSTNPVPLIAISQKWQGKASGEVEAIGSDLSLLPPTGMLADVAPTILAVLDIKKPADMTGEALLD